LLRIKKLEVLEEEFKRPEGFSLDDYFKGCIGLIKDEKRFKVRLKIDPPTSTKVSERIWVEGQKVSFNEDGSIIFEAKMTGVVDIVNWVLGLGSKVEVLEPKELREKVKEEARRILGKN